MQTNTTVAATKPASAKRTTKGKGKGKPAPAAQPAATTPNAGAQLVTVGATKYSPRAGTAQGNDQSWAEVTAFLSRQKGGKAPLASVAAHLQATRNHAPFAKYCLRRGWLVAAK